MRGRIRNILGDCLYLALLIGVAYVALMINEGRVCETEKECLTLYEN
jgi:hypothetical protein